MAAVGISAFACGGPEKPPLTPDGPLETMPVGSDAGDTPATPTPPVKTGK